MSVHFVVDSYEYTLAPNGNVTARATIGNAQAGGWRMTLDDVELAKGTVSQDVPVGSAQAVKGKTLEVTVTCVDVNPTTNDTVATVGMQGGASAQKLEQDYDDGGAGDTTVFTFLVDLV